MKFSAKVKHVMKVIVAVIWTIILPVYYAHSRRKYTCYPTRYGSWLQEWCFSSYMVAVAIYLMTNAVEMVLFLVPSIRKYIEISNHRICTILSWWTQVSLSRSFPFVLEYILSRTVFCDKLITTGYELIALDTMIPVNLFSS